MTRCQTNTKNRCIMTFIIILLFLCLPHLIAGAHGRTNEPQKTEAPEIILDIDDGSFDLSWTAPGDDDTSGIADHYIIRYSTQALDDSNWNQASNVPEPPSPLEAGNSQSFTVTGLACGGFYYFAVKTVDDAGNISPLSNIASGYASGIPVPAPDETTIDTLNASALLSARTVSSHLAVYYEFALDTSLAYSSPEVQVCLLSDSLATAAFSGLSHSAQYFWRCRAMASNRSDSSHWSDSRSFTISSIDLMAPEVIITSPVEGDTIDGESITISWRATDNRAIAHYIVSYSVDGGSSWIEALQNVGGDSGYFTWPNPGLGYECGIKVACFDAAENLGYDSVLFLPVSIRDRDNSLPAAYSLSQNYPNPFNPSTTIGYTIPRYSQVTLEIFDLVGHRVATLVDREQPAGFYEVTWNGEDLASGAYIYRLAAGQFVETKKTLLIK